MENSQGPRNRNAGHTWEKTIAAVLNSFETLPEMVTSREFNKYFDDNKIDLVTNPIEEMENLEIAIQAKTTTTSLIYPKLLKSLSEGVKKCFKAGGIPVLFHKQTEKKGDRFLPRERFAILYMRDFVSIFVKMNAYKKGYKILSNYFDSISEEEQIKVHEQLTKLGL